MKLLVWSDSTTTEWTLVDGESIIDRYTTEGINPTLQTRREVSHTIRLDLPQSYFKRKLKKVYYYGTGCDSPQKQETVKASLIAQFRTPTEVEIDLLAAARSMFGNTPGIACILGTASGSCFYDGKEIVHSIRSGGYILGDEGSAVAIGKHFASDLIKGLAPNSLTTEFYKQFAITPENVIDQTYDHRTAMQFLPQIAHFLLQYLNTTYVYDLFMTNLEQFFEKNVCRYDYKQYPVKICGNMVAKYGEMLTKAGNKFGINPETVGHMPLQELATYHFNNPEEA